MRSVTLQYGSAICCRSVKVLALRVRVAHVEHFASQRASVPQWPSLKKMIWDFWRDVGWASCGFNKKENNMLLTDIAVEHTRVSKQNGVRQTYLLHPFTNTQRDTLGKFEIVRDVREPGFKEVKRSAFVTFQQLAELYAKGVLEEFGFSVRMCPGQGTYPTANPVKKILPTSIRPGSPFVLAVQKVDVSKPASRELTTALLRTHVKL